jgi:hypothetical protein
MPVQRRRNVLIAATLLGGVAIAAPAQAIPLIGIGASGGAYVGVLTNKQSGFAFELEGSGQALGLDVAGNLLGNMGAGGKQLEVGLRKELSFIPMVSVKPMVGYQGQSFFTGTWDHAPLARLDLGFSPILSPVWFDGTVGVSYPFGFGHPVGQAMIGGNLALLPLASIGVRYRTYQDLSGSTGGSRDFGAVEVGLRVTI